MLGVIGLHHGHLVNPLEQLLGLFARQEILCQLVHMLLLVLRNGIQIIAQLRKERVFLKQVQRLPIC